MAPTYLFEKEHCAFGIDNTAGHYGVTIENGTIRDFATAVFVFGANDNGLRDLSASHNILVAFQ